ncbi:hypothetical protein, partial [Enterobacter ludwigii]|uniref:hypothetical protein n=1 Tax=Enterobacter ludwigii TaxID=299767 RepID=UPI0018B0B719
ALFELAKQQLRHRVARIIDPELVHRRQGVRAAGVHPGSQRRVVLRSPDVAVQVIDRLAVFDCVQPGQLLSLEQAGGQVLLQVGLRGRIAGHRRQDRRA